MIAGTTGSLFGKEKNIKRGQCCLFIFFFCTIHISRFFSSYFFCYPHFFFHPHFSIRIFPSASAIQVSGPRFTDTQYLRCLLRSKISAAHKRVGNMSYFQRNGFIFNVKILKEVRFSESLLFLLEIRFVWNNGAQKHSLSIDVRCPASGQFFLCCAESMN